MARAPRKIRTEMLDMQIDRQFVRRGVGRLLHDVNGRWGFKVCITGGACRRFEHRGTFAECKAAAIVFAQSIRGGVGIILDDGC